MGGAVHPAIDPIRIQRHPGDNPAMTASRVYAGFAVGFVQYRYIRMYLYVRFKSLSQSKRLCMHGHEARRGHYWS